MTTEHPILFNTEMVRKILSGKKTETRRIIKNQKKLINKSPYGKSGDILWVRETFKPDKDGNPIYRANIQTENLIKNWKPSIFMPKKFCRIYLQIEKVCIENIRDITTEGAIAEGTESIPDFIKLWDSINFSRGYGWAIFPFVWVVKFKRIDR